jgi:hypothetical protein
MLIFVSDYCVKPKIQIINYFQKIYKLKNNKMFLFIFKKIVSKLNQN